MMRAAPQPKFPTTTMTQARARGPTAPTVLLSLFIYYVIIIIIYSFIISTYHNDARRPSAQISHCHNDPGAGAWPNIYYIFYLINYILCYYNYNLIIYPYHNDARSPSAQISRYHNVAGARAQPLSPKVLLFKLN